MAAEVGGGHLEERVLCDLAVPSHIGILSPAAALQDRLQLHEG